MGLYEHIQVIMNLITGVGPTEDRFQATLLMKIASLIVLICDTTMDKANPAKIMLWTSQNKHPGNKQLSGLPSPVPQKCIQEHN